jgi:hypothetical protein
VGYKPLVLPILLTLTAIHTREMSAASEDVRHIAHIFGRIYKQELYHHTFNSNWLPLRIWARFKLLIPSRSITGYLSVDHFSHTAHPEQLAMMMEDRLDLEHYIDSFVSVRRVPPTWFGQRPGGVPANKRLAVCLSRYAVGIDRQNRVLWSTATCLKS